MEIKDIKKLTAFMNSGKTEFSYTVGEEKESFTVDTAQEVLREELFKLCKDQASYEKNKWDLFAIIGETVDAKLPKELEKLFMGFATTKQYGENDKVEITIKRDNKQRRARAFVTKVTPAGVYEVFKLAKDSKFQLEMTAIGGAIQIAFEDFFLTGRVDWNELVEILALGMQDRIYDEVLAVLKQTEAQLPGANVASSTDFDSKMLEKLIGIVGAYGEPVIMCTETFARAITEGTDWASEIEKVARRNVGYLTNYKGAKIVLLPQSYTDETNSIKVTPDEKAYIMPAGREGLFHIAFQGDTHINEVPMQADWSRELHTYKKFGVASLVWNDICTYTITSLK